MNSLKILFLIDVISINNLQCYGDLIQIQLTMIIS